MTRRLLNLLTVLTLLLCMATIALHARSRHRRDNVWFRTGGGRLWWLESSAGQLTLRTVRGWPARAGWRWTTSPPASDPAALALAGDRPLMLMPRDPRTSPVRYRSGATYTTADGGPPANRVLTRDMPASPAMAYHEFVAPHWAAAALAAAPPAAWAATLLARALRRRAVKSNHCPRCGYDLRATPDRCPECGTAASVSALP